MYSYCARNAGVSRPSVNRLIASLTTVSSATPFAVDGVRGSGTGGVGRAGLNRRLMSAILTGSKQDGLLPELVGVDHQLDAAVAGFAGGGRVADDRMVAAVADQEELVWPQVSSGGEIVENAHCQAG